MNRAVDTKRWMIYGFIVVSITRENTLDNV